MNACVVNRNYNTFFVQLQFIQILAQNDALERERHHAMENIKKKYETKRRMDEITSIRKAKEARTVKLLKSCNRRKRHVSTLINNRNNLLRTACQVITKYKIRKNLKV